MVTPTEIYKQAADAIAAGRFREGSRLAYEAAFAATVDAAARHNAPCASDADAGEFLIWLDNPPFPRRNGTSTTTPRAKICCPYLSSPRDSAWRFPSGNTPKLSPSSLTETAPFTGTMTNTLFT